MTLLPTIGILLAIGGSVLGLAGAWLTASEDMRMRHWGFFCWICNSPMIVISMIGIAVGVWEGIAVAAFIPLNLLYWGTAARGFITTKADIEIEQEYPASSYLHSLVNRGKLNKSEWI